MRSAKRAALAAISLLAVLATARAEEAAEARAIGVDEAVRLALEGNLGLGREAIALATAERNSGAALNLIYPSVEAGLSATRSSADLPSEADRWSATGSLSLGLSLSPKLKIQVEQLKQAYRSGLVGYDEAARELELSVRKAFCAVLLDQAKLSLAEQNLERAKKNYEQAKAKYSGGLAPEIDLLTATVSYEAKGPAVESARVALEDDLDAFKLLLGLDPAARIELAGDLDSARSISSQTVAAALAAAPADGGPALRSLRASLEAARLSLRLAKAGLFSPSISASASSRKVMTDLGGARDVAENGSLSLSLTIPLDDLLPSSATRLSIASAEDSVAKLELQLEESLASARSSWASLSRGIGASVASLAAKDRGVELAQKKYDLINEAYQRGLRDIADLDDAASDLNAARAEVVTGEYSLLTAALELESSLGARFGTIGR